MLNVKLIFNIPMKRLSHSLSGEIQNVLTQFILEVLIKQQAKNLLTKLQMDVQDRANSESDDERVGYYTRSKRRKLENGSDDKTRDENKALRRVRNNLTYKRKCPIMTIPIELLSMIFKKLSYQELNETVRLVCSKFKIIAEDILNIAFKVMEKRIKNLVSTTNLSLCYTSDDMEIRCLLKLLNFLENIQWQHRMVYVTIWRYVYNDIYYTTKASMYAGRLLDSIDDFIWKFLHNPSPLYGASIITNNSLPEEVKTIARLAKSFCLHFERVNEEVQKKCLSWSGCKMIDLVESTKYSNKSVISENENDGIFTAKYSFYFRDGWFVGLPVKKVKEMAPPLKQRMMFMRLRRIVLAQNDVGLQQSQYERELMMRTNATQRIPQPDNNVYTGYGDAADTFFYYGIMNRRAYTRRFEGDDDGSEDEVEYLNEGDVARQRGINQPMVPNNSDENLLYSVNRLGFRLDFEVRCPLIYAPLNYIKNLDEDALAELKKKRATENTYIKMNFECLAAIYPRLPLHFEYEFTSKKQ